jgi:hypothetical protein
VTEGASEQRRGIGGLSPRAAASIAWSVWAISLVLLALDALLGALTRPAPMSGGSPLIFDALFQALPIAFPTVGALVASRRPGNPIGWIFCAVGFIFALQPFSEAYTDYALYAQPDSLLGVEFTAWISQWIAFPAFLLGAVLLFLLFPDGRLLTRRWRFVVWVAIIASVLFALGTALTPGKLAGTPSIVNPFGIGGVIGGVVPARRFLEAVSNIGFLLALLSVTVSVMSPILRLRRSSGEQRQQLKWFVYAATLTVIGFSGILISLTGIFFNAGILNTIVWYLGPLALMMLPVSAGVAILRYRLYNIDVIINRTLVYGALTSLLAAGYFGAIMALQGIGSLVVQVPFRAITGQESQLAAVAATLAMAALFNPLRRRIQSFIDRRFYRKKYDARKTLEAFSAKLRHETDLEALNNDLVGVVRETMQPTHVSLWLRPDRGSTRSEGNREPLG